MTLTRRCGTVGRKPCPSFATRIDLKLTSLFQGLRFMDDIYLLLRPGCFPEIQNIQQVRQLILKQDQILTEPSTSLVVILGALLLDVATVSLITPTEASTAQSGLLLSLSLPFTTLTLAAIVYLLATIQAYPAIGHDHQSEAGIQDSNHNVQQHPHPQRQYLYQPAAEHYCKYAELPTTTAGSH